MRLVLDTDVLVAAMRSASGASRVLLGAALEGRFTLILTVPLFVQYEEVLSRPAQLAAARASQAQVDAVLDALAGCCLPADVNFSYRPTLPDPTDEIVLEAAYSGAADALVTFSIRDFRGAERFGVRVCRPYDTLLDLRRRGSL